MGNEGHGRPSPVNAPPRRRPWPVIRPRTRYVRRMKDFLIVVLVLLMAGVLGVLVTGMVGLVRGGGDPHRSNKLMQWRVALQAAAILLLILIMSLASSS